LTEWAAEQSKETLQRLGSKRGKPPSERTYRRILGSIDVKELDRRTGDWVAEQQRLGPADQGAVPFQSTVRTFPAINRRDPLVAALFGAAAPGA